MDPNHPEHQNMKSWCGRDRWDPAEFDINTANSWLAEIKI